MRPLIAVRPDIWRKVTLDCRRGRFPQIDAPWGALQRSQGERPPRRTLSRGFRRYGDLGIRHDNLREPGPELRETAGITNGCDPGSSCGRISGVRLDWVDAVGNFSNSMRRGGRYNAPKGSGPHGELFAEDSGSYGDLGIRQDNLREPRPELHETAGITNGCDP